MSKTYCATVRSGQLHAVHTAYHDLEYGFLITDDNLLFERLILEINQAGLSWEIILKKRDGFRNAYAHFDLKQVAAFTFKDEIRLLSDTGIIRNKLKVKAAIENAKRILRLQHQDGSFSAWLEKYRGFDLPEWKKLFKQTFVFTGGEIVSEFLISLGYLGGAHDTDCPVGQQIKS